MSDLTAKCAMTAATQVIFAGTWAILALTGICQLNSMCLWSQGGLKRPQGGPPLYMKKISMSKIDF